MSRDFVKSVTREFTRSTNRDRLTTPGASNYPIALLLKSKWGAFDYAGAWESPFAGVTPTPGKTRYRKARLTRTYNGAQRIDEVDYADGLSEPTWANVRLDAGYQAIFGTSPALTTNFGLPLMPPGSTATTRFQIWDDRPGQVKTALLELYDPDVDFFDAFQEEARNTLEQIPFSTNPSLDWEHWSEGVIKETGKYNAFSNYQFKATSSLEKTYQTNGTVFGDDAPGVFGAHTGWQLAAPSILKPDRTLYGAAGPFPAWAWMLNVAKVNIRRTNANAVEFRWVNVGITTETACARNREFTNGIMMPPRTSEPRVIVGVVAYPPYRQNQVVGNVPTPSCFAT